MKIIRESNDVTLDEVAKGYGTEVAKALVKYCNEMRTTPDEVLNDMTEDDRGMTKWDKFDNWAKRKLGLDVMGNFDDETDWTGAEDDRKRAIDESSGMTDQEILDWIGQEVSEAEWCSDLTFDDYDATLEVETMDGDRFEIIVKKMEEGSKDDVMLEGEDSDDWSADDGEVTIQWLIDDNTLGIQSSSLETIGVDLELIDPEEPDTLIDAIKFELKKLYKMSFTEDEDFIIDDEAEFWKSIGVNPNRTGISE